MTYLDATEEAGRRFVSRRITGDVVMLNLLRFRAAADYSAFPDLAPAEPVSIAAAYGRALEDSRLLPLAPLEPPA